MPFLDPMTGSHRVRHMVWFDDVNRADSNTSGDMWVEGETGGSTIQVASNTFINTSSTASFQRHITYLPSLDQWIECRVTDPGSLVGMLLRCRSALDSTHYLACSEGSNMVIYRYNTGSTTLATVAFTPSVGDILRFEARGANLRLYVNGQLKVAAVDSILLTAGRFWAGLRLDGTDDVGVDDISAGVL